MACHFVKVLEEEIEETFFYPSDLVNFILKQLSPSGLVRSCGYIHHYSPPLRGIVVYYFLCQEVRVLNVHKMSAHFIVPW